jgi:hypothetical protein
MAQVSSLLLMPVRTRLSMQPTLTGDLALFLGDGHDVALRLALEADAAQRVVREPWPAWR